MRVIKGRKRKNSFLLKIVLLIFVGYVIFTFVNQQMQINQKKVEYEQKVQEVAVQNIKNEEIIAIGDNINDKKMIQNAGMGIAMEGSTNEVTQIANYVTDNNSENGVAKALRKLILE